MIAAEKAADTNGVSYQQMMETAGKAVADAITSRWSIAEKAIKYNSLIANMIMLQNVIDISRVVQQLQVEGWSTHKEDLTELSPYLTAHLKRFGDFVLNLNENDGNIEDIREKPLFNQSLW